jgi:hypothetical protein
MAIDRSKARLRSIAQKILSSANLSPEQRRFWEQPLRDLETLLSRDYEGALRENVRREEVRSLIGSARGFWPTLNRTKVPLPTKADFLSISNGLGLNLSIQECRNRDGMALRGFYLRPTGAASKDRRRRNRKDGLIYLNTAHHPAAVGATFCHEIGHHLALGILPPHDEREVHYFFDAAYSSHLDDPMELAADALVSVAAYPRPVARQIFGQRTADANELGGDLRPILHYLKSGWEIDLEGSQQPRHHLIYLVGMVHYAKLRRALLIEYQI